MRRFLKAVGWIFAIAGWVLLLISLWTPDLLRTFLPSILRALGTVIGGAAALSLILAIIQGYFLQKIKAWYEKQKSDAAHAQKIVEEMVKNLHAYSEKYYMPIGRTAQRFLTASRRGDTLDAFYFFVLHQYHRNRFADELGAYFLKNITAEVVLGRLGRKASDLLILPHGFLSWGEIDRLLSMVLPSGPKTTRFEFQQKIENGWGKEKYEQFGAWLRQNSAAAQNALRYLDAYTLLLLLEVNLGYGAWYGEVHADLTEGAYETIRAALDELIKDQRLPLREAEIYRKRLDPLVIRPEAKA